VVVGNSVVDVVSVVVGVVVTILSVKGLIVGGKVTLTVRGGMERVVKGGIVGGLITGGFGGGAQQLLVVDVLIAIS